MYNKYNVKEEPIQNIGNEKWISMSEAAPRTPYSAEYLSLLARKKKLPSKKVGNVWYTTEPALADYMQRQMARAQISNSQFPLSNQASVANFQKDLRMEPIRSFQGDINKYFPWNNQKPAPDNQEHSIAHVEKALEKVLDKKIKEQERVNQQPSTNDRQQKNLEKNSHFKNAFASKFLLAATIAVVIVMTVLPVPFVFSFFDKSVDFIKDSWNDANTVMGFRPGTHANEILLLDQEGNVSIMGHIETEGQLRSYASDGIAPIVVDSKTTVTNLSSDSVDGISTEEFTLAFVTKNGNVTTENVVLNGDVSIGQTLLVRGATKLLNELEIEGNLKTFGNAEFMQALEVMGPAYFESVVNMANDLKVKGNLAVNKNISVRGSVEAISAVIGKSGSFGNLSSRGDLSVADDATIGGDLEVTDIEASDISADSITAGSGTFTSLTATNATSTNLFSTTASFTDGTITNLQFTYGTGTSATTTNFFSNIFRSALATITSLIADDITVGALTATNSTTTNATTTNSFSTTASSTNLFSTSGNIGSLTAVDATSSTFAITGNGAGLIFSGTGNHDITASGGTLRIGSNTIIGNIYALDNTVDIGTAGTRFDKIYANEVNASTLVGTIDGGNVNAEAVTINFDNATADTEDSYLAFERGSLTPNALLAWDSTNDRFTLNSDLAVLGGIGNGSLLVTSSTTLQNFTFVNATGTSATTTNFFANNFSLTSGSIGALNSLLTFSGTDHAGLRLNNLTTVERDLITPALGMTIYNTTASKMQVYNGSWKNVGNPEIGAEVTSGTAHSVLFVDVSGNLGQDSVNFTFTDATDTLNATNLTFTSATGTSATTTNFFSTNANITNLTTGTFRAGTILPIADNTYDLGSVSERWKTLHVGPGSVVVHNDTTDTLKATLGFSGSTAKLFTDAATPLQITTGANFGINIITSGNVGIGTTNPGTNLHVKDTIGAAAVVSVDGAGGTAAWTRYDIDGVIKGYVGYRDTNAALSFYESGADQMVIKSGNVGIGTTSPSTKLTVATSNATGLPSMYIDNDSAGSNALSMIGFRNQSSDKTFIGYTKGGTVFGDLSEQSLIASSGASIPLVFYTGGIAASNERMRITSAGNVGIGTTNPASMLSVGATSQFQVSSAGAITGTSLALGSGAITTTGTITSGLINGQTISSAASFTGTLSAASSITAAYFSDTSVGGYHVDLGGESGRGVAAGYSGSAYGGVGYNIQHTGTNNVYVAPGGDTVSYLRFDAGGFNFLGSPGGVAGRNPTMTSLMSIAASGAVTGGTYNGQTISSAANFTGTMAIAGAVTLTSTLGKANDTFRFNSGYADFRFGAENSGNYGLLVYGNGSTATYANIQARDGYVYLSDSNTYTNYYLRADGTTVYMPGAVSAGSSFSAPDFYAGGWFRNDGLNEGLYNSVADNHFYSESTSYWTSASDNGMIFRTAHASTVKGYVYHDANGFGLLNNSGNWSLRIAAGDNYIQTAREFYPGRTDGNMQTSYYLAGSPSWGLHTNTSMNIQGGLYLSGQSGAYLYNDGTYIRSSTYLRATSGIYSDSWIEAAGNVVFSNEAYFSNGNYTRMNSNQFYCNNGSACHFNYSGSGYTYVGNGGNTGNSITTVGGRVDIPYYVYYNSGGFTGTVCYAAFVYGWLQCDPSDEKLKNIQGEYEGGLAQLRGINTIRYALKSNPEDFTVGFSAQNVQSVLPEGATTATGPDGEYLTLNTKAILALAVNSIIELDTRTASLEKDSSQTESEKQNVSDFSGGLALINSLKTKAYNLIGSEIEYHGFVVEDVASTSPSAIVEREDGTKIVDYLAFIPALVQSVQDLYAQIVEMKDSMLAWADRFVSRELVATEKICIGETCINESQLAQILENAGLTASALTNDQQPTTNSTSTTTDSTATSTDSTTDTNGGNGNEGEVTGETSTSTPSTTESTPEAASAESSGEPQPTTETVTEPAPEETTTTTEPEPAA